MKFHIPSIGRHQVLLVFVALIASQVLLSCKEQDTEIRDLLRESARCEVDTDCTTIGSFCPFGCSIPANQKKADTVSALLRNYTKEKEANCEYDCMNATGVICEKGYCTTTFTN